MGAALTIIRTITRAGVTPITTVAILITIAVVPTTTVTGTPAAAAGSWQIGVVGGGLRYGEVGHEAGSGGPASVA